MQVLARPLRWSTVTDMTATPHAVPPTPDSLVLGRYRLVDRVGDGAGTSFWRALDERLRRPVGLRLMPLDHPRVDALRAAAVEASLVTDRRAVPVLDIVDDAATGHLVVITEWIVATPFGRFLAQRGGDPLPAGQAAVVALEVARFLAAAEDAGVAHARIRPNAVMLTDTGEVRVSGLGVDRVLFGVQPDVEPGRADVHGVGAILFAGLTGRWPGPDPVPDLALVATLDHGRAPWPSRVVAEVPADLDRIVARSLVTTTPPKGDPAFTEIGQVVVALAAAVGPEPIRSAPLRSRTALRVGSVAVGAAAAVGLGALGLSLVLGAGSGALTSVRPAPGSSSALPSTVGAAPTSAGERVIPVVSVRDFDPFGDTQEENPRLAPLAIDDNPSTAWRTVRYRSADLSGKPGVGLLLDLGAPRPVSVVELRLVGNGTDLSLRSSDDPTVAPERFRSMAEVTGAGSSLVLRVPSPVTTRYLLVWLTQLPSEDGSYQGGVSDVIVRG